MFPQPVDDDVEQITNLILSIENDRQPMTVMIDSREFSTFKKKQVINWNSQDCIDWAINVRDQLNLFHVDQIDVNVFRLVDGQQLLSYTKDDFCSLMGIDGRIYGPKFYSIFKKTVLRKAQQEKCQGGMSSDFAYGASTSYGTCEPQGAYGYGTSDYQEASGSGSFSAWYESSGTDTEMNIEYYRPQFRYWLRKTHRGTGVASWQFLRRLLNDGVSNPSLIRYESESEGIFTLVNEKLISAIWDQRKTDNTTLGVTSFKKALK